MWLWGERGYEYDPFAYKVSDRCSCGVRIDRSLFDDKRVRHVRVKCEQCEKWYCLEYQLFICPHAANTSKLKGI